MTKPIEKDNQPSPPQIALNLVENRKEKDLCIMENVQNSTIRHYDQLIDENNDPVLDPKPLQEYMNMWDGPVFIEQMQLNTDKSVLEIGVGTGRLAVRTAPLCGRFVGIDISAKTAQRACEHLSKIKNATVLCGDFLTFTFLQPFDVIYSSLTFMHIKEKQKAIDKIALLLQDGGLFVLSTDKNQDGYIDTGTRRIIVFPDTPADTVSYIAHAGLTLIKQYETEFAHIFVAKKERHSP